MLAAAPAPVDSFFSRDNEPQAMGTINPKYRQLKAFVLAVESESFRVAADRLCVTQPSFSALIKDLESDLGTPLFEREGRGTRVTAAGERFYQAVAAPLAQVENAYERAKGAGNLAAPSLAVATLPSLSAGLVGDMVARFRGEHPRVRITLFELKHNQIPGAVIRREVDFGIGSFLEKHPSLRFTTLFHDSLVMIAPPSHPILELPPSWESLRGFDFVLLTGGPTEHGLSASGATPANILRIEQAPTALAMVRRGMGVTILPATILPSCHVDGLIVRTMEGELAFRNIGLILRDGEPLSATAREFLEMLNELEAPYSLGERATPSEISSASVRSKGT
jgi:LysR family carnitine catabolism transcriptional activator